MEKELLEQFQKLSEQIGGAENRLSQRIDSVENGLSQLTKRMDAQDNEISQIKGIVINLENNLTKKIEVLFDGYKLNHEKQWELERKVEQLEKRLEALEIKTA